MKITLYTITSCQFSQQEKQYLSSHGLQFVEKNLETNREFLTEMLAVGSNFAGTPVTKIEKDDGQIIVLKGFTASEFDAALGFTSTAAPTSTPVSGVESAPTPPPEQTAPPMPPPVETVPQTPVEPTSAPVTPTPTVLQPEAPVQAQTTDPAMASILSNLEQVAEPPVSTTPPTAQPPTGAPTIPDPKF